MGAGKLNRRQKEEIECHLLSMKLVAGKQITESSKRFLTDIRFSRPSVGSDHPADTVNDVSPAATYKAGRSVEQLRQIDEALQRLDSEEFGICEDCGNPIAFGRLKAVPMAVRCVSCEESHELAITENGNSRRARFIRRDHRARFASAAAM